jgi:GDP-mannose 4,6-dehydratase
VTGFVGSHMAEFLLTKKDEVYGTYRWRSPTENIDHIKDKITLVNCELLDAKSTYEAIKKAKPDVIYHLAAQSYVPVSFEEPTYTIQANVIGTLNILEAVRSLGLDPVVHICSSSEVYGQVRQDEVPIKENNPLRPASPYAVSKVGEDFIGLQYFLSYKIKTIRTRMFTHTGPRRGSVFAESAFAKQIAEIELGIKKDNTVYVGNLDSVRTFADVRDAVKAYWLLTQKCIPGEVYNIGGNRTMKVGEMLDYLISQSPKKKQIKIKVDPALLRPSDVTLQIPCIDKFVNQTGWKPEITFEKTMQDLLNYWRETLKKNK